MKFTLFITTLVATASLAACASAPVHPTAQASVALLALTATRLAAAGRVGVVTSDQALPSQW